METDTPMPPQPQVHHHDPLKSRSKMSKPAILVVLGLLAAIGIFFIYRSLASSYPPPQLTGPADNASLTSTPTFSWNAPPGSGSGGTAIINDSATGTGTNQFEYVAAADWKVPPSDPNKYNGDDHYSQTVGSYFQIRFTGSIVVYGTRDAHHGITDITLDGNPYGSSDLYSATRAYKQPITLTGMLSGIHTLRFTVSGRKNPASTGIVITNDYATVTTQGTSTAREYRLQVAKSSNPTFDRAKPGDPLLIDNQVVGTSYDPTRANPPQLLGNAAYIWHVRVKNSNTDFGDWSVVRHFTIGTPPPPPPPPVGPPPPTANAHYTDCAASANGSGTQTSPWTIAQARSASLSAGSTLLIKRGGSCGSSFTVGWTGVTITAYGAGALPKFSSGATTGSIFSVTGDNNTIDGIEVVGPSTASSGSAGGTLHGFNFANGATGNTLKNSMASGTYSGVVLNATANNNKILSNELHHNNMLSNGNSGANGVNLWGSNEEIAYNYFHDNDAKTSAFGGSDGSSVEVYTFSGDPASSNNTIHHNHTVNDNAFTELGKAGGAATPDNFLFAYNTYTAANINWGLFLNTRCTAADGYGPITGVKAYNNSVYVTGSIKAAVVGQGGCSASTLTFKNNILSSSGGAISATGAAQSNNLTNGSSYCGAPGNLHLKAGSAALNAGIDDSITAAYPAIFATDLDGHAKSGIRDIGAYEGSSC